MDVVEALVLQHSEIRRWLEALKINAGLEKNRDEDISLNGLKESTEFIDNSIYTHFKIEEEGVLEALSTLTDIEGPSIDFVDDDHDKLEELLEDWKTAVRTEDRASIRRLSEEINDKMNSHMKREEQSVYYMVDKFLTREQIKLIEDKIKVKPTV